MKPHYRQFLHKNYIIIQYLSFFYLSSIQSSLSFSDMQDFSQLSSKTVTEVLMLEMKMAPAAKAYLISGYPRSMRDVVEYSEKVSDPTPYTLSRIVCGSKPEYLVPISDVPTLLLLQETMNPNTMSDNYRKSHSAHSTAHTTSSSVKP